MTGKVFAMTEDCHCERSAAALSQLLSLRGFSHRSLVSVNSSIEDCFVPRNDRKSFCNDRRLSLRTKCSSLVTTSVTARL